MTSAPTYAFRRSEEHLAAGELRACSLESACALRNRDVHPPPGRPGPLKCTKRRVWCGNPFVQPHGCYSEGACAQPNIFAVGVSLKAHGAAAAGRGGTLGQATVGRHRTPAGCCCCYCCCHARSSIAITAQPTGRPTDIPSQTPPIRGRRPPSPLTCNPPAIKPRSSSPPAEPEESHSCPQGRRSPCHCHHHHHPKPTAGITTVCSKPERLAARPRPLRERLLAPSSIFRSTSV